MCSLSIRAIEAQASANVYAFLASVFSSQPTQDSVRAVREMASGVGLPCPNGFSLEELDREYMELFVIPNPRYVAPYESVFRDRWELPPILAKGSNPGENGRTIKGLLMGESTQKVRQIFVEAGIMPNEDLPDHIANELRLMAFLWSKESAVPADSSQVSRELREKFRQEHMLQWIGQLRGKLEENDRLGYYRAAVQLVETVLQSDAA